VSPSTAEVPRPWWALVLGLLALLLSAYLAVGDGGRGEAETGMLAVAPGGELALHEIPHEQRELYLAADEDPEAFHAVRCYCGCEDFLGHPDLRACFLRPGGGWEAHATGCGICLAQAEIVRDLREAGTPLTDVIDAIDERYGAITT
jgi:hypothetical protein